MKNYETYTGKDPDEPPIPASEYNLLYMSLIGEIQKQIKKTLSQIRYCKEDEPYLKKHYEQKLNELYQWETSIKNAKLRAFNKLKED